MSLFNSLDKNAAFDELNSPLMIQGVVKAPATRKAEALINLGFTATIDELNAVADQSLNTQVVAAGGGAVTLGSNGGIILIPLLTANATVAVPLPSLGKRYRFIWIGTAADAEDVIMTTAATSFFVGGLTSLISGTADITPVYANGTTHNTLSCLNPDGGSWVELVGVSATQWAVYGNMNSVATAPTFTAV